MPRVTEDADPQRTPSARPPADRQFDAVMGEMARMSLRMESLRDRVDRLEMICEHFLGELAAPEVTEEMPSGEPMGTPCRMSEPSPPAEEKE